MQLQKERRKKDRQTDRHSGQTRKRRKISPWEIPLSVIAAPWIGSIHSTPRLVRQAARTKPDGKKEDRKRVDPNFPVLFLTPTPRGGWSAAGGSRNMMGGRSTDGWMDIPRMQLQSRIVPPASRKEWTVFVLFL